jgi:site-specific DNA recombinase
MEEKNLIVIYGRVSSAAQSLELQLTAAKRYLESEGLTGNEDFIVELSDHDISATKLKINQRPKLMEMIKLIKEGKVKKVIGYKRDRFARNFYEFVDITKVFIKNDVNVVYTASNEPPFRDKLALETFYGMFGQMEGENIRTRTNNARKQYPSNIFGYKRLKENEQVHYVINPEKQELIVSLFTEFGSVKDEEQFLDFLTKRRTGVSKAEKVIRILTNPFYAGHYESKSGLQALPHVEPMINMDLYLKAKSQIDRFITYFEEKLIESNNHFTIIPICSICRNEMKHRKENDFDKGYFVCSASHKRVMVTVDELNHLVNQTVMEHVQSISVQSANKVISKRIASTKKRLQHEQEMSTSEYLDASLTLCTFDWTRKSNNISKQLDKITFMKDKYNKIGQDLVSLQMLKNEIKNINTLLSSSALEFSQQDVQRLIELLVNKVFVHDSYLEVELFLSTFAKDLDVS